MILLITDCKWLSAVLVYTYKYADLVEMALFQEELCFSGSNAEGSQPVRGLLELSLLTAPLRNYVS